MALNAVMESLDGLSEDVASLYTERDGKYELTGISGVRTQSDVERLQTSLDKERQAHKGTKDKFSVWGDLDHSDVMTKLDRIPELEAAAAGKLDDAAIDEMVNKRLEGKINTQTAPLQRQIEQLTKTNEELQAQNAAYAEADIRRTVSDSVRDALTKGKVLNEAQEDALLLAERVFEVTEDGKVLTKDQSGVTPGVTPEVWLTEMQEKRPHWWPASSGGGARGGSGQGGGAANPWSKDNWNMTEQAKYVQAHGMERATQMAKSAGTSIGGGKPK